MILRRLPAICFSALFSLSLLTLSGCELPVSSNSADNTNSSTTSTNIPQVEIPFQKAVLDNGLTLIVHEDRKTPIVAVNVWYHVGSKDEQPGKTGFAHLFEHLMFQGSENYNDEYFRPLEEVGATEMNGTTNSDRTNYFANVPTPALDRLLWMESDRMGHLLGVISQDRLDEQRDVVKNEKRQRENAPYGRVWQRVGKAVYPEGHPYSWPTIGSMEDLDAANLDDVKTWFKTHYGAANAVIAIVGDIDFETALAKTEKYFGDIPAGPPLEKAQSWPAIQTEAKRDSMQDQVPQARVIKAWSLPPQTDPVTTELDLFSNILAAGKNSRLYQRLVYEDQIATDVFAGVWGRELGSQFLVWATAQPGGDLKAVEKAVNEEIQRLLEEGPTAEELERTRTKSFSSFLRGVERIGGFGGKSDILAASEVYGGNPDAWKEDIAVLRNATPEAIQKTAQTWLTENHYTLEVHPYPEYTVSENSADRSAVPEAGQAPDLKLPEFQRATTDSGLKVILAERHSAPLVDFSLLFNAGYATDGLQPGLATLAANMLDEGTSTRSALEIAAELESLGTGLSAGSNLDTSSVSLSTIKTHTEASLEILADVLQNASYPKKEFERLQKQTLAKIAQEKASPFSLALRILPPLLYGDGHPYAVPFTGSGRSESVSNLAVEDTRDWYERWLHPDNATLIVVGDITMDELLPMLNASLSSWTGHGDKPAVLEIAEPDLHKGTQIYLLNRDNSQQATVFAGQTAPAPDALQDIPYTTLNAVLGGMFTSRINLNLREDKGWSYGAKTALVDALGVRPWIAYSKVEIKHAADAMQEILDEITGIQGTAPTTPAELSAAQRSLTLKLPGQHETNSAVAGTIADVISFNLPDDYYSTFVSRTNALETDDLTEAANELLKPQDLIWVVVGDLNKLYPQINELIDNKGWPPAIELDASGKLKGNKPAKEDIRDQQGSK